MSASNIHIHSMQVRAWMCSRISFIAICVLIIASTVSAQEPPVPTVFTLDQALQFAADHHPAVIASREDAAAAAERVTVAQSSYWPRLDAIWQSNRATVNNVFGQLLPQSVVPPISGPVLESTSGSGVWGSAAGGLLAWEPFDFGSRGATVRAADQALARARAGESLDALQRQVIAGARFLDAAAAALAVDVAVADVARRDVLVRSVRALVDNQLRPGVELSRAEAERAAAETRLIQARETSALAVIELSRALGLTTDVAINASSVTDRIADPIATAPSDVHPLMLLQKASLDLAQADADVARTSWRPRFLLQASLSARGSGAAVSGNHDGGIGGLALDRTNWAGGVQIVFPNAFEFRAQRARTAAADAHVRAESARRTEALNTLSAERRSAAARLTAARAIAANTPVQLTAARQSEAQSRARYDAGLTGVIEVAEAQSLLAAAEFEDRAARIRTWSALLESAAADGDLTNFITAVRAAERRP